MQQGYCLDIWHTAILRQALPADSLRTPTTPYSTTIIEDCALDLHHQGLLSQANDGLKEWQAYVGNLIYNHKDDADFNRRKAEWNIVKVLSADEPSQAELEQAYMYIKVNSDQEAHDTGTAADYDTYVDMLFTKLLSTAAYPHAMMRHHNNFIFELKRHFAKGNPLRQLKKTVITSVLRPTFMLGDKIESPVVSAGTGNSLLSPFTFMLAPQSGPDFQADLLVAAEDDRTPSAMNRFPAINAATTLQESGTYKPLKAGSFESSISNTSAHQLALAERTLTITEHFCSVSRSFSFTAVGSTAGFIYVPDNSPQNAPIQTLRGFFTAKATHDIYGGTFRTAWTEATKRHEAMLLEAHEQVDRLNPEDFYTVQLKLVLNQAP